MSKSDKKKTPRITDIGSPKCHVKRIDGDIITWLRTVNYQQWFLCGRLVENSVRKSENMMSKQPNMTHPKKTQKFMKTTFNPIVRTHFPAANSILKTPDTKNKHWFQKNHHFQKIHKKSSEKWPRITDLDLVKCHVKRIYGDMIPRQDHSPISDLGSDKRISNLVG